MTRTPLVRHVDIDLTPERLRDALSVLPSTVEDDVRERLMTPLPTAALEDDERWLGLRRDKDVGG